MVIEKLPKKDILQFESIEKFGIWRVADYYAACDYQICEYSLGIKLMWAEVYRYAFAECGGCLICRDEYDGVVYFDFPVAGKNGDVEAALCAIEAYCLATETSLRFTTVPASYLGMLSARYDGVEIQNTYRYRDYVYRCESIERFEGKKYAGQRNHLRRFQKNYPDAIFRRLTHDDLPAIERFAARFNENVRHFNDEALTERESAFRILRDQAHEHFFIGCMEYRGEIIGVAIGECCGDTLVEHVEKALSTDYEGVYPALFQAFVKTFGSGCTYVNREDDAGERGLRTSKLQYHPERIVTKYDIYVKNLLHFVDSIPELSTERLTLNAIQPSDAADYGRLCLDDARNRYWGYDYREDFGDRIPSGADFCRVAAEDFDARYAANFAVRLGKRLIGEVIVYHFDFRGSAEIGVRIAPEYAGQGYGREALAAASDWALYGLGATKLVAQCFRENDASAKMLASLMRKIGDDGRMLRFERLV